MKTVVKLNPDKEYDFAKGVIGSLACKHTENDQISKLDSSVDNLKTIINVLIERLTPKKRKDPKRRKRKNKTPTDVEKDLKKLPSEKYPELPVEENIVKEEHPPLCPCCQKSMTESGVYSTAEKLEVIPKQYYIVRNKRAIYVCQSCHSGMQTAPAVPSISPTSNYGDSVVIDAALSKYCDLIPMERYCQMAAREGLENLPPNSMINLTHQLADFLNVVYERIKSEVLAADVIFADETPHKMLEGDQTKNWFLWGFSSPKACYLEAHNTRKGEIPTVFLRDSAATHLLTDGYSGYKKALTELQSEGREILEAYCNAHAFRYFEEASTTWEEECEPYLKMYGQIYDLERHAKDDEQLLEARKHMVPLFATMQEKCESDRSTAMPNSGFEKALQYFLNHVSGLTRCLHNIAIPLDNNLSERLLRNPVIGRKTWYGSHSKKGANTSATLFSIVESCKLCGLNPRAYFKWLVERIHKKSSIKTPSQWAAEIDSG